MGWPWLDARCLPRLFYSSPPYSSTQGRKDTKNSWAEVRAGRDPTLLTITGKRIDLGQMNWSFYQLHQRRIMRNEIKSQNTFPLSFPSSWAQLYSLFCLPAPPHEHREQGIVPQSITHCPCCSSSSGPGLLTSFPCSTVGTFPWETVLHELLPHGSFHYETSTVWITINMAAV